ncbi:rhodanese-related sulfurtransferase [Bellilinea caldifistulae]|uniref:Sulfurtransferase n=1 Tax=Bellilinea caldifistulae TaxID=360411 RepID=A0A0P6X503_9CHLR|nr:sulfurtransferase [Bellilinea caldifistulae]KPL75021.1 3-mercaptopyruvate sulfurtransferase [Bellilinea caldifistulae]GAP10674.1 rhodanese-related sulfurtransferase [Bellilinea caldifistulae]
MTPYTTVIEVEELFPHYHDPHWVIVDCRFDLTNPQWGFEDYQRGHVPGSVYAHLDHDLSAPPTPQTGRHPLPSPSDFAITLERLGISNDSQVVALDTSGGSFAARLWWMLKWMGHDSVAVLNGGWNAWKVAGFSIAQGVENKPRGKFIPHPQFGKFVSTLEMVELIGNSDFKVVDARAPERYRGEIEPLDPVAGHIPGSINRFHEKNLARAGKLKPAELLRKEFEELLGDTPPSQVIVYCGSGVTSCHHLLAMEYAGIQGAKLYAGSWSEWIRDPNRPVELG